MNGKISKKLSDKQDTPPQLQALHNFLEFSNFDIDIYTTFEKAKQLI